MDLKPTTAVSPWLFPGITTRQKPICVSWESNVSIDWREGVIGWWSSSLCLSFNTPKSRNVEPWAEIEPTDVPGAQKGREIDVLKKVHSLRPLQQQSCRARTAIPSNLRQVEESEWV